MMTMKRIPVPAWAPPHARHVVHLSGDLGGVARDAITPLLPRIYAELDRRVNQFVNDPDQCFNGPDTFPVRDNLDGRYYFGSETYEGHAANDFFRYWVDVRCLEKPRHPNQEREGYDNLGLEAIVTVDRDGIGFGFEDNFNTSSI
jgi:hypothetical protein